MKAQQRRVITNALSSSPRLGRAWAGRQISKQRVGFAWYTKRQWARLRELADDPEALDDSYDDWLRTAEATVADLRSKGVQVQKVPLNVEVAAQWCAKRSRPFNSAGRAAFAADLLRKQS